jgi:hypothetical protein
LLDKSRWLSVLVCQELTERGVSADKILLEHTAGGDEVDCLADIFGSLVLFELKDKPFNLGNAYSFGAKIPIFQPDYPVVLTTEYVGGDAKEHFARSREPSRRGSRYDRDNAGSSVLYIEGLDTLPAALDGLISSIQRHRASRLIKDALAASSLPHAALIKRIESSNAQNHGMVAGESLSADFADNAEAVGQLAAGDEQS